MEGKRITEKAKVARVMVIGRRRLKEGGRKGKAEAARVRVGKERRGWKCRMRQREGVGWEKRLRPHGYG